MWDELYYQFPNVNGCTVEVWGGISNFIPRLPEYVITYPHWNLSWYMLVKGGPKIDYRSYLAIAFIDWGQSVTRPGEWLIPDVK